MSQYGLSDGSKVHLTSKTRAPLVCRPDSGVQTAGLEQHTDLKSKECDVAAVDHMTCLRTFLLKYFNSEDADKVVQRFREVCVRSMFVCVICTSSLLVFVSEDLCACLYVYLYVY